MVLKDRKLLLRLIAIQDVSIRSLAKASGFRSHSYMNRLISGQVNSCTAERAVAICAVLQVPLDSLFLTKMSSDPVRTSKARFRSGTAAGSRPTGAAATGRGPQRQAAETAAEVRSA